MRTESVLIYKAIPGHDQVAGHIRRMTAGHGGEVWLIDGRTRTAIYDTGMSYCAPAMIENLQRDLRGRPLDAVLLSHTHYDHVGGLPYLLKTWPRLEVYGSFYGQAILEKASALAAIRKMSDNAAQTYLGPDTPPLNYSDSEMTVNRPVREGDLIAVGDLNVRVYETKGHTNCSLSYYIVEDDLLLTSESTGYLTGDDYMRAPFLSGYHDAVASIEKSRRLAPGLIIPPHRRQGAIVGAETYWDCALQAAEEQKDFVLAALRQGLDDEEILHRSELRFWTGEKQADQPIEAFKVNMRAKIGLIRREFYHKGDNFDG